MAVSGLGAVRALPSKAAEEGLRRSDRARAVGMCFAMPTADSVRGEQHKGRRRVAAASQPLLA